MVKIRSKLLAAGVMTAGAGLYFLANFQRVAVPGTIFGELQSSLGLSAVQITALGAIFMYVYAVGQLFAGLCTDRFGGVRTILAGGALFTAGSLLFPFADAPLVLYLARFLAGLGASSLYLALAKLMLAEFPARRSVAISVLIMLGYAGGIVAGAPVAALVSDFGWQPVLAGAGFAALTIYLLFALLGAFSVKPPLAGSAFTPKIYLEILKSRHNRRIFLFNAVNFGSCYVLQTVIGKKYLEDFAGMSSVRAAGVISAMAIASAAGSMLFSVLSQSLGNRRKLFYLIAAGAACFAYASLTLLWLGDFRIGGLSGALMIFAAVPSSMGGITIPYLAETNPDAMAVSAAAFSNFSSFIAVALFGNASGVLLKCFPAAGTSYAPQAYGTLFAVLTTLSVLVFVLTLTLRETFGKKVEVR